MTKSRFFHVFFVFAGLVAPSGMARSETPAISDANVIQTVDARLADWWLKPDERRFDRIGWAPDVRTAQKLAAEHSRPLFLFTMDGRVNTGRC
jgi:hypothetical protein